MPRSWSRCVALSHFTRVETKARWVGFNHRSMWLQTTELHYPLCLGPQLLHLLSGAAFFHSSSPSSSWERAPRRGERETEAPRTSQSIPRQELWLQNVLGQPEMLTLSASKPRGRRGGRIWKGKKLGFRAQTLGPPLINHVTLSHIWNVSDTHFPICKMG